LLLLLLIKSTSPELTLIGIIFLFYFRHVLKTNFYQPTKVALSFRLAPEFLPETEYPKKPFGMFFVIGRPLSPNVEIFALNSCFR